MASLKELVLASPLFVKILGVVLGARLIWALARTVYNVAFHPLSGLPGPFPARFMSSYISLSHMRGDRAQTLLKLHTHYGPIVRVGPNEVSVSDWRAYRQIYNTKTSRKEESFYSVGSIAGVHDSIFSMRNKAAHAARRKMQAQPYSQAAVMANEGLIARKAEILVDRAIAYAGGGGKMRATSRSVDMFPLCGLFSLEVILQCAFNHDSGSDADGSAVRMLKLMDASARSLPVKAALPGITRLGLGPYLPGAAGEAFRATEQWKDMNRELMVEFARNEQQALDKTQRFLVTPLLVEKDDFLGRRLNEEEVLEECMSIAFAGSGTTSTTLVYFMYALARPKGLACQGRLREELMATGRTKGEKLGLRDLQGLPYLNAVIKETMRLYPTILSTLPRTLEEPIVLSGKVIPPGTNIGMQNYVHHRDPDLFPHPEEFRPDRWLDPGNEGTKDRLAALTPFSLGPRNCIGQNFAKAELYLAVAEIFSRMSLRLSVDMTEDDMEMEDRFNIAPRGRKLLLDVEPL